ncbi:MAG: DUF1015 family protein [Oscillospiraceae bacterium]|jgi:uncharacterized protein (DUF1015 family)|nr:DUF1015 family protein [Oscillospiraceae bacterium]
MAVFKPFRAIRPDTKYAKQVAALPYDVMTSDEARVAVQGNPYSFLRVDKAEVDLDVSVENYDERVYRKARENLDKLCFDNILKQDENPMLYIYRQTMDKRSQTGLVGCASIDDYINNKIKKHELTREDKEVDRINHVDYCNANTGPIFLTYRDNEDINSIISSWQRSFEPVYDFDDDGGISHTVWVINDKDIIEKLQGLFCKVDSLYIADGHHRSASAVKVGLKRREQNPGFTGNEEFNFFLCVAFPQSELKIMDYNRVVKDLNGLTPDEFLVRVQEKFELYKSADNAPYKPDSLHMFGMFMGSTWYKLCAKPGTYDENDPVLSLDVSILQNNLIGPILGIDDPRTSQRIDFVGGIRGLHELSRRVNTDMAVAFSMYPTSVDELMDIADFGNIMPPKSTWFEPKLLSGLFIHKL